MRPLPGTGSFSLQSDRPLANPAEHDTIYRCLPACPPPGAGGSFYAYNTMRNPRVAALAGGFSLAYLFGGWVVWAG